MKREAKSVTGFVVMEWHEIVRTEFLYKVRILEPADSRDKPFVVRQATIDDPAIDVLVAFDQMLGATLTLQLIEAVYECGFLSSCKEGTRLKNKVCIHDMPTTPGKCDEIRKTNGYIFWHNQRLNQFVLTDYAGLVHSEVSLPCTEASRDQRHIYCPMNEKAKGAFDKISSIKSYIDQCQSRWMSAFLGRIFTAGNATNPNTKKRGP